MTFTNWRRKISCYKYSFLELLALKTNLFYKILMDMRKPVFEKEIKIAKVTEKDKVLFIGGGIFPSESILMAELTNAKIVTIDNSKTACKHAKAYIQKKKLSENVIVEYGDGVNYPVKDFDVIFIAISVWPIDNVFQNLSKNVKVNTRVLCKTYRSDIVSVFKNKNFAKDFYLKEKLENPKTQSFLFVKKSKD